MRLPYPAKLATLGSYVGRGRWTKKPSYRPDAPLVVLRALVASKVALFQATLGQRMDKTRLAERIGLTERAVERLVDLDRSSPVGQVESALRELDRLTRAC